MSNLSKPEQVRERIAGVCSYHFYCRKLWTARMDVTIFGMDVELLSTIANHHGKTYDRIDDIIFGHPCGISIA